MRWWIALPVFLAWGVLLVLCFFLAFCIVAKIYITITRSDITVTEVIKHTYRDICGF